MAEVRRGKAFSPSHITAFFQIYPNGSTGAGLNTTDGAVTDVAVLPEPEPRTMITVNGEISDAPVSRRVVEAFRQAERTSAQLKRGTVEVTHRIFCPIGYGMGMSGAGALSLSLALNQAIGHPLSYAECMEVARRAEIESGTGLGDVVGQQYSGLMVGLPPYPSMDVGTIGDAPSHVVCAFFEPIETARIIRNPEWKASINAIGAECMEAIHREPTFSTFLRLARDFTFRTKLCSPQLEEVLTKLPESSMAMLGQTAFIATDDIASAVVKLSQFTPRIYVSSLTSIGASEISDRRPQPVGVHR